MSAHRRAEARHRSGETKKRLRRCARSGTHRVKRATHCAKCRRKSSVPMSVCAKHCVFLALIKSERSETRYTTVMIKRVLIISLIVFIIALIIFWFITGGWAGAARTARSLANPLELIFGASASGSFLKLPWQPPELTRGPDISDYAGEADARILASGDEDQFANTPPASTGAFGNPSPYAGKVVIRESAATESDAAQEYIQLTASQNNTQPISITNWTLQSAVSGARGILPPAAPFFVLGAVNTVQGVYLEPGDSVFITTGARSEEHTSELQSQ